jgi:hypothetical protein
MNIAGYFKSIFDDPRGTPYPQAEDYPKSRAKPRLAAVTKAPSREAFDAWREHPVTLFVFAALSHAARENETAWKDASWQGGIADQVLLNELRVRADAYKSLEEGGYEAFCEWAGVEADGGAVDRV